MLQTYPARMREALEAARAVLADTQRGRGERARGERLLIVLGGLEGLFGNLVAMADDVLALSPDGSPDGSEAAAARWEVRRALGGFTGTVRELAKLVSSEHPAPAAPPVAWDGAAVLLAAHALEASERHRVDRARLRHVAQGLERMRELSSTLVATAMELETGLTREGGAAAWPPLVPQARPSWTAPLRDNLTLDSVILRHALRVAVTLMFAVGLTALFPSSHGYWVTITVFTIMLPHTGATLLKAMQRVLGTLLGSAIAIALTTVLHAPWALLPVIFCTATLCIGLLPLNYGAYTTFVTLTFVLLTEIGSNDWTLAPVRVENTLLGGLLALAGSLLLWEVPERHLFQKELAKAFDASVVLLRAAVQASVDAGSILAPPAVTEARRRVGLALLNAEASLQRLLLDPRRREKQIEPRSTMLTFVRRSTAALVALATPSQEPLSAAGRAVVLDFADALEATLQDLAQAMREGRLPQAHPSWSAVLDRAPTTGRDATPVLQVEAPLLRSKLERLSRQLTVIHGAAARSSLL